MPMKGVFVVSFMRVRYQKRGLHVKETLDMVHDIKNREEDPFSWGVHKNLNFRILVLRVWEERINLKKIIFFFIFFSPLHLL